MSRSQLLQGDHPLHRPSPDKRLGEAALFGVSEAKMKELAQSFPSNSKQELTYNFSNSIKSARDAKEIISEEDIAITPENQHEMIAKRVAPFWQMRYSDQLQEKEKKAAIVLKTLKRRLIEVSAPDLPAPQPRLPCPLQPIIASVSIENHAVLIKSLLSVTKCCINLLN